MTTEDGLPKGPNLDRKFYLGADQFGRDVLVRIAYGARVSLVVGIVATGFAPARGGDGRADHGVLRGRGRHGAVRFMDVLLSIPLLLLALALVAVSPTQHPPGHHRRDRVRQLDLHRPHHPRPGPLAAGEGVRGGPSARSAPATCGSSSATSSPTWSRRSLIYATLIIPANILFEAYLSFLGLGVPPPTATWGQMLADATDFYRVAWWLLLFPGLALLGTTLAFDLAGDGLRDALDPRGQQVVHQ